MFLVYSVFRLYMPIASGNIPKCKFVLFSGLFIAHLRMCEESTEIGCDEKEDGFICQCSTDYCNKNLITCHKESRCEQTLHRYTQKSDKETELHGNK